MILPDVIATILHFGMTQAEFNFQQYALADAQRRVAEVGANALSNTDLLMIVLGTGATRDAQHLAEQLITQGGGLLGVARLGIAQLSEPTNMGLAKAAQLQSAFALSSRVHTEMQGHRPLIKTPSEAATWFIPILGMLEQEEVHTMLLDARNRVIATPMIYRGTLNASNMRVAEVFREAIRHNAANVIVAHNHPSGDPSPSPDDIYTTRELVRAGKLLEIGRASCRERV